MGKTIRRKHVSDSRIINNYCTTYKADFKECLYRTCSFNCPFRDNEKTIRDFRKDTKSNYGWAGHAPSDFRRMINREKRAKMKAELTRINKKGDYENYSFDKWVKDAGWLYW